MKSNRGQQSIEYLTTYVYATIAIVLVIGAISYLEVFKPEQVIEEECNSGEQVSCLESLIIDNGQVLVKLENHLERDINITSTTLYYGDEENTTSTNIVIPSGKMKDISMNATKNYFDGGKKERVYFKLEYKPEGSLNTYSITGEVKAVASFENELEDWTTLCGNNHVDIKETCDPPTFTKIDNVFVQTGPLPNSDCGGKIICSHDCTCQEPECGNGLVEYFDDTGNPKNEICDITDSETSSVPCDKLDLTQNEKRSLRNAAKVEAERYDPECDDELIIEGDYFASCDECKSYDISGCRATLTFLISFDNQPVDDQTIPFPDGITQIYNYYDNVMSPICCLPEQCVFNSQCYDLGSTVDINNDDYRETCGAENMWMWTFIS